MAYKDNFLTSMIDALKYHYSDLDQPLFKSTKIASLRKLPNTQTEASGCLLHTIMLLYTNKFNFLGIFIDLGSNIL